jgi:hypothetical protein
MKKLVVILSVLILVSCDNYINCPECFTPPEGIRFQIISSVDFSDLIYNKIINSDSIRLYYIENKTKKDVEFLLVTDTILKQSLIYSRELSWKSAESINDFFLDLNTVDTDTVFLDVEQVQSNCCTYFLNKAFKINGINIEIDSIGYFYKYVK